MRASRAIERSNFETDSRPRRAQERLREIFPVMKTVTLVSPENFEWVMRNHEICGRHHHPPTVKKIKEAPESFVTRTILLTRVLDMGNRLFVDCADADALCATKDLINEGAYSPKNVPVTVREFATYAEYLANGSTLNEDGTFAGAPRHMSDVDKLRDTIQAVSLMSDVRDISAAEACKVVFEASKDRPENKHNQVLLSGRLRIAEMCFRDLSYRRAANTLFDYFDRNEISDVLTKTYLTHANISTIFLYGSDLLRLSFDQAYKMPPSCSITLAEKLVAHSENRAAGGIKGFTAAAFRNEAESVLCAEHSAANAAATAAVAAAAAVDGAGGSGSRQLRTRGNPDYAEHSPPPSPRALKRLGEKMLAILAADRARINGKDCRLCTSALDAYNECAVVPCGHQFCRLCINNSVEQAWQRTVEGTSVEPPLCPTCRKKIENITPSIPWISGRASRCTSRRAQPES